MAHLEGVEPPLEVMFLGTYDLSKPRNRILLRGLREAGAHLVECHEPVWESVRDKATLGSWQLARHMARAVRGYGRLALRFARATKPDVVWIGYMGHVDVVVLGVLARLRGVPVVWDQFISLHDTVVGDRALLGAENPLARLLYAWEWLACRSANLVLMDTQAHAEHVRRAYGLPEEGVDYVWVGVEPEQFLPGSAPPVKPSQPLEVLFYGQFIALHGIETIVRAARLLEGQPIHFSLIGTGQEDAHIREMLVEQPLSNLSWEPWVRYEDLNQRIREADVCLGIFGTSGKAGRVIPNKVFQIVSAQRPLITRESPAIRELFRGDEPGLWLVPSGDPVALADRLRALAADRSALPHAPHASLSDAIAPRGVATRALSLLQAAVERARRA